MFPKRQQKAVERATSVWRQRHKTAAAGNAQRQAFALVLILPILALLLVLVITILQSSLGGRRAARTEQDVSSSQALAEIATNLVFRQIRAASSQSDDVTEGHTWASQPGALRRYALDGTTEKIYKLYSASQLVIPDETTLGLDQPPDDWSSEEMSAQFVDMNEPYANGSSVRFPIVDPRAAGVIDGFDFDASAIVGGQKNGTAATSRLPMPVRWLYVLENGTIGTLDDNNRFVGPEIPDAENPIVGRIAYWTDDESTKINLNTASEPTPWDTPRSTNQTDFLYGRYQPAQKEYQRYNGHAFTTALSPVLYPGRTSLTVAEKEQIYGIIPRVAPGGTRGGTVAASAIPNPDADRLFSTVDEFIFSPKLDANRKRTTNTIVATDTMERNRFFLTAQSRSPEITAFGTPRIPVWPLAASTQSRTAFDHLVAYCSTIGGRPWYFQRGNALSSTNDWVNIPRNQELFAYLRRMTALPVPGYGASFATKWTQGTTSDQNQILTNIFDYIRSVNLNDVSKGASPYAPRGQIVPIQIDDYDTKGLGRFLTLSEFSLHFICLGDGKDGGRGAKKPDGSPLAEDERLIQCSLLVEPYSISPGWIPLYENIYVRLRGLEGLGIGGQNSASQKLGFPAEPADLNVRRDSYYTGWHGVPWGTSYGVRESIGRLGNGYPFLSAKIVVKATGENPTMSFEGGNLIATLFAGTGGAMDPTPVQEFRLTFPNGNFPMPSLVETGTGAYRGANVTTKDWWWGFGGRYASTVWNRPHAPGPEYADISRQWPNDNGNNPSGFMEGGVFRMEDVVRSLVPYHGDYRLIAGQRRVHLSANGAGPIFVPHAYYNDINRKIDHIISEPMGPHMVYGFANEPGLNPYLNENKQLTSKAVRAPLEQLTPAPYHWSKLPDVPKGAGLYNKTGDFDNGVAQIQDGPYINKPDEGNLSSLNGYPYYHWAFANPTEVHFSPNRIISSPVAFGSLPTGVQRDRPWETLLFRRQPKHPGAEDPPDHCLLDLFWMPAIEPYAISESFSTAGKVNLNYQIVPFTYITRSTAMRAVLKSEEMMVLPTDAAISYKLFDHETSDWPWMPDNPRGNLNPESLSYWVKLRDGVVKSRVPIEEKITLAQFDKRFADGELFTSASALCDVHLVPNLTATERVAQQPRGGLPGAFNQDVLDAEMETFWAGHVINGDNTREKPYGNIHGRVTTRSNTYRIHFRVQTIRKARSSDPAIMDPEKDSIASEYRGSRLIERFLDPTGSGIPDHAVVPDAVSLENKYQFRILETTRFTP